MLMRDKPAIFLQVGEHEQGVDEISGWFTTALGIRCRLVQQVCITLPP